MDDMISSSLLVRASRYAPLLHKEIECYLLSTSRNVNQKLAMRRDIDIALLRAFVAVVETGSVTGAAALLNLTQAAVSQQLKRLEELFGTGLFERHHKRLSLKPAGERLMAHAQKLIALNDEVWSTMSAPAYEGGCASAYRTTSSAPTCRRS